MEEYINSDGVNSWYGNHYVLDMHGVKISDFGEYHILKLLKNAAIEAKATILHSYIHPFDGGGFSGVVVLQESHISIHTWPEKQFAAVDV
jgi:S-adenosylmethionine decarboxylase